MLDKLGGVFAPRPSTGPHKLRESLPLLIFLRNRLKYALNGAEVTKIVMQRLIKVDGKVRTDPTYPAGFMGKLLLLQICESVPGSTDILIYCRCHHHWENRRVLPFGLWRQGTFHHSPYFRWGSQGEFWLNIIAAGIAWLHRRPIDVVIVRKLVQNEAQSNFWYDGLWSVHS